MKWEIPDVQAGLQRGRGTRDQIANSCWIMEKAKEFQKNIYFCFIDYSKVFYFYFYFFRFLFLLYFTLQYCIVFAIHWHESTMGVHEFPNPEAPSHLPPHIISLDLPRASAPNILYPVSNIDWRLVSYMIVYMFQCHSPKSSHPLPLLQSPKVRYTHLCLFCCLAYRVIIAIFLNSIYMC